MTQNYNNSSSLRRFRYGSRNLFLARPLGSRPVKISGMNGRALGRQRHSTYTQAHLQVVGRVSKFSNNSEKTYVLSHVFLFDVSAMNPQQVGSF